MSLTRSSFPISAIASLLLSVGGLSSCMIYTDQEVPVKVEGRVIDEKGTPVPEATVTLISQRTYFPGLLILVPHQMPPFRTETTTQSDGRFYLDGKISSASRKHMLFVTQKDSEFITYLARVPYVQGDTFQILRATSEMKFPLR